MNTVLSNENSTIRELTTLELQDVSGGHLHLGHAWHKVTHGISHAVHVIGHHISGNVSVSIPT